MVPKSVELRTIGFTGPHKEVHDKLYDVCRKGYLALLCAGAEAFRKQAFSLFGLMMRIRQSCCSSHLVTEADCQAIDMVWEEFNTVDLDLLDAESGVELFERLVAALRARRGNNTIDTGGESHEAIAKRPRMGLGTAPKIIPRNLAGRHPKIMALMDAIHKIPAGEKGTMVLHSFHFFSLVFALYLMILLLLQPLVRYATALFFFFLFLKLQASFTLSGRPIWTSFNPT